MNYGKILSVVASACLLGSTLVGASYPSPYVSDGLANGAIVVGENAASSDWSASIDLASSLNTGISSVENTETTTETSLEGEAFPLFTGSSKLYLNDPINSVRSTLTETELPKILSDGEFSGNVDADYTQRIELGSSAVLTYTQQPDSSDDDPVIGVSLDGCNDASPIYTSEIRFNKVVDFTNPDSKGEDLILFGQKYTVGAETSDSELVLYKSSKTIDLSIGDEGETTATVSVGGADYIVKLISADADEAVIKVTDSSGDSSSKELNEGESKNIQGLDVALTRAHVSEALGREMVEITVGSEKMILKHGSKVKIGVEEDSVKGTEVVFEGIPGSLRAIKIKVWESDDEKDAILEGGTFMDPIFNTFGISFTKLNKPFKAEANETLSREEIKIAPSDDDVMSIQFTTHGGDEDTFDWYESGSLFNDGDKIHVVEGAEIHEDEYVVVGNEDDGYLLQLTNLEADEDEYSDNEIIFTNVFDSDEEFEVTIFNETYGDVYIGGQKYGIEYNQTTGVRLDYPDSTGSDIVVYPTIQTSMGAKIGFYEPVTGFQLGYNLTDTNGLKIPDGDGYGGASMYTINTSQDVNGTLNLKDRDGNEIHNAALVIFEEEDDAGVYTPIIVKISGDGDDVGVSYSGLIQHESDDDISTDVDVYGTLFTLDDSGDGASLTISYPDDQLYAELFVSEGEVVSTTTTSNTPVANNVLVVKDTEVDSVSSKNLIVVGGSCINKVAAAILGVSYPLCGEEFTDATGIGAGNYLTKVVASPYNNEKIAMLVSGYNAVDTIEGINAVKSGLVSTELS